MKNSLIKARLKASATRVLAVIVAFIQNKSKHNHPNIKMC